MTLRGGTHGERHARTAAGPAQRAASGWHRDTSAPGSGDGARSRENQTLEADR